MNRACVTALLWVSFAGAARADSPATGAAEQRFGIGVAVGVFAIPTAHLGIPEGSDMSSVHMPSTLVFRWRASDSFALDASFGIPAAMGCAVTVGAEWYRPIWSDRHGLMRLDIYEAPGVFGGFAGPDWYARNENAYVGYEYLVTGLPTFGFQFPAGVRVHWLKVPIDVFAEAQPLLAVTPSAEEFITVALGIRARF